MAEHPLSISAKRIEISRGPEGFYGINALIKRDIFLGQRLQCGLTSPEWLVNRLFLNIHLQNDRGQSHGPL